MSVLNESLPSDSGATLCSTLSQFPKLTGNPNEKIKTQEFIEACNGIVTLVGKFGKIFSPVTYDINGNIKKLTRKYEEDTVNYENVEDMLLKLQLEGQLMVVDAVQWLRRGLHFISRFFQQVIDDSANPRPSSNLCNFMENAYKETLERYHGWLGSQLFHILLRSTPSRPQLLYALALDKTENVLKDLTAYNERLTSCIDKLIVFYQENELETNYRV